MNNVEEVLEFLHHRDKLQEILPSCFELDEELYSGGQGVVYVGKCSGMKAAIKIYYPSQDTSRVNREIEAVKNLRCPKIVEIIANNKINVSGTEFQVLATKFIDGDNLANIIEKRKLRYSELTSLLLDGTNSINCLWKSRIVHRDIKPSNIVMNTKQEFILIDLGVARHLDKTTLTSYGFTLGTIGYLSSEQMKAQRNLTCKSDMFSLGIVLLEAGLGHHPTNYNQKEILNIRDLVEDEYVRGWQFATLLEKILAIKAYERPHPEEVIQCIEQRGGK